jgi:MSHA biogenesis protein MshJ
MKKQIELINEWISKRNKREKMIIFFVSLFVIYFICNFIFIQPVIGAQEILKTQINELKSQRETMEKQFDEVYKVVQSPEFVSLLSEQKQLASKRKDVKEAIAGFKPIFVAESDFLKLTKDILGQLDKNIVLISLKEFPDQQWTMPEIDKSNILVQNIQQHKLAIEFHANYFDTMAYLKRLERLPWHLYWDSLEYKVTKYPEADVIVQLYILSNQKSA